jgi:hypothetical protein
VHHGVTLESGKVAHGKARPRHIADRKIRPDGTIVFLADEIHPAIEAALERGGASGLSERKSELNFGALLDTQGIEKCASDGDDASRAGFLRACIANLIVWPSLFDKLRRTILGSQMMVCRGRLQPASGVIHIIAELLIDQTDLLNNVGGANETFTLPAGRGDEAPTSRRTRSSRRRSDQEGPGHLYIPDLRIDTLAVKARNFR